MLRPSFLIGGAANRVPCAGRNGRSRREFWMSRRTITTQLKTANPETKKRWFPYTDQFMLDKDTSMTSAMVIENMESLLVDPRKQRFDEVIANRTFSICPVVEGLHDLGNISAVFRTAEGFGMQSVHVILNKERRCYKSERRISMGTEKWLDVEIWDTTGDCIFALRDRGFRIAVTGVGDDTIPIDQMDWTVPTAVIFGNEGRGISEEAVSLADVKCNIPILGMVDSFNVSVAAGILMHHTVNDRIARAGAHGDLTMEEQQILRAEFYLRHRRDVTNIMEHLILKKRRLQVQD